MIRINKGDIMDQYDFTYKVPDNFKEKLVRFLLQNGNSAMSEKLLKPSKSGYLIRNIDYIICDDNFEIILPEERGDSFEILSKDIYDALGRDQPSLVLDRLHTYTIKYIRTICSKHSIPISNETSTNYPIHSLIGSLAKYYKEEKVFESDFAYQAMKMQYLRNIMKLGTIKVMHTTTMYWIMLKLNT